jgi:hypothetical protein
MYRAPSKRRQLITRIIVYSLMTLGVVLLVTLLVFIMLGYRFNRDTSSIQQGGLVQFASRPIDASVTIGKAKLGDLTPSKITVNPGNYDVKMSKTGYRDWMKNVDVQSGEVLWLNYSQLVPNDIQTDQLTKFDTIADAKSSPNGDRYAVLTEASKPVVTFVDVSGSQPRLDEVTIPSTVLPVNKTVTLSLKQWANDSDRILLAMKYDEVTQWLVIDRRSADRTINISKSYESDIAEAVFDPRSSERVIVRTSEGDIRLVNSAANSLSSIIATNVTSMSLLDNDALLLVQSVPTGGQSVGYVSLGSAEVRVVKQIPSNEKASIAIGKYFSEPYIAVSVGTTLDVYRARTLPSSDSDAVISMTNVYSTVLPAIVDHLSIRTGGRFVVAQYAGGLQTYDIELKKQNLTSFKAPVSGELRWLDKYHFYLTTGTNLDVMEFDGGNGHTITGLSTQLDAVQSDDGKFIYSINQSESGFVLQRSRMIVE